MSEMTAKIGKCTAFTSRYPDLSYQTRRVAEDLLLTSKGVCQFYFATEVITLNVEYIKRVLKNKDKDEHHLNCRSATSLALMHLLKADSVVYSTTANKAR